MGPDVVGMPGCFVATLDFLDWLSQTSGNRPRAERSWSSSQGFVRSGTKYGNNRIGPKHMGHIELNGDVGKRIAAMIIESKEINVKV